MEQIIIFSMMVMSFLAFTSACVLYVLGDFKVVFNENKTLDNDEVNDI